MALSVPLWVPNRRFPLSPLFEFSSSAGLSIALSLAAAVLLALQVITAERRLIFGFVPILAALICLDLNRLQPWVYYYTFILTAFGVYGLGETGFRSSRRVIQLIFASIYLWSGAQKLNLSYFLRIPAWLAQPFLTLPKPLPQMLILLILAGPFLELATGAMLLSPRSRQRGVIFCAGMHLFILFALGPLGRNANHIVWPWNIASAGLVFYLFFFDRETTRAELFQPKDWMHRLAFALFVVAPIGSFFGVWNHYLASALYSANGRVARIRVTPHVLERMEPDVRSEFEMDAGAPMLHLGAWTMHELNVPEFPSREVQWRSASWFCRYAEQEGDVQLWFYDPPPVNRLAKEHVVDCVR